jgi:RNA polymerase sigma-70 factor (ECF subfamily)
MRDETPEFIPTRSSLLSRLKDWDDQEGWQDFFNIYWKLIYHTAMQAGLSDTEAQDVVQDTVVSVAKKMRDFKYDPALGSFKGWLMQLTGWRIKNQLKKRMPRGLEPSVGDDTSGTTLLERIPDPASLEVSAIWDREWERNLMDAAIERVKEKVSARQYEIFYLHVVKKFPAGQVAATLNANVAQVYLAKHRVSSLVKKEVRRPEKRGI